MKNHMKWIKKVGVILMGIVMFGSIIPVYAAPDWNEITTVETESAYANIQRMQCAYDEENLYLHIAGGASEAEDLLPQLQLIINQKPLEGDLGNLLLVCDSIEDGENPLSVQDRQLRELGAQGTLNRSDGINDIDIAIPFTALGYESKDILDVTVNALIDGNKEGECAGVSLIQETEPIEIPEAISEPEVSGEPEQGQIVMDGQFSDWNGYDLTYGGERGVDKVSMVSDGTSLYIRIVEDGSYDQCFPRESTPMGITSNMGKVLWLDGQMHGEGEEMTLTFQGIEGAYAVCGKVDGIYNWEIEVPLSEVWSGITYVSDISLMWKSEHKTILTVPNPSYIDRGNPGGGLGVAAEITVDGYFEDWDSIPHMEITYDNENGPNNHIGALYMGEDYMYVHYKMNRLYTSYMRIQYMEFKINGNKYTLEVLPVDANGNIDWSVNTNHLQNGIHTNFGVFLTEVSGASQYRNNLNGQTALVIYDSSHQRDTLGDEVEFSISYDRIEELTGIKHSEIRKVELYNPNIGDEWLVCVGTSSGPLLGVGISITAAAGLYYVLSRKKRKKEDSI